MEPGSEGASGRHRIIVVITVTSHPGPQGELRLFRPQECKTKPLETLMDPSLHPVSVPTITVITLASAHVYSVPVILWASTCFPSHAPRPSVPDHHGKASAKRISICRRVSRRIELGPTWGGSFSIFPQAIQ